MAAQDPVNWFLPAAFYFSVKFQGEPRIGEVAFREVSGLSAEMEFEEVACGGMNDHKLLLPKGVKHANVVLKRAMMPRENNFGEWVHGTLEGGFAAPIVPRNVEITLLNEDGDPMYWWLCAGAWPVKWDAQPFDAQKNELAVESIELTYSTLTRGQ